MRIFHKQKTYGTGSQCSYLLVLSQGDMSQNEKTTKSEIRQRKSMGGDVENSTESLNSRIRAAEHKIKELYDEKEEATKDKI